MITFEQLKLLEKYLDQAWKMLGIDVSFTRHFLERANDPRNGKPIDIRELQKLFVEAYKKYGSMFSRMKLGDNEIEGVLTDLSTKINSPFVLSWDAKSREFDLRAKTVMRKKNFVPNNPRERKYTVEDRYKHEWSEHDRAHGPDWTDWIAKKLGTRKWIVGQLTDRLKEKGYTVGISQTQYAALNKQYRELYEEKERTQMSLNKKFGVSDDFAKIANSIAEEGRKQKAEEARALEEASKARMKELLGEDVEQIDELSKKTLGSYIKKASHDVATKSAATGRYGERTNVAQDKYKKGDYSGWQQGRKDNETADKFFKKSWKRREGIAKAVDKLTKEDAEQIDEISSDTLKRYKVKADMNMHQNIGAYKAHRDLGTPSTGRKFLDKAVKREKGIHKADEKIARDADKPKTFTAKVGHMVKKMRRDWHDATNPNKTPEHLKTNVEKARENRKYFRTEEVEKKK